jgi:DNA polymerase alpha subunit A
VDIATHDLGLDVIYGDTDSVMINTSSTDLALVKEIGERVIKKVNETYKALVLDRDGIFSSMLLLKKKKYAAVVIEEIDGDLIRKRELKGLDLVRRDWCPLSKKTGMFVVDKILSGKKSEEIVHSIHDELRTLATHMRQGKKMMEEYVVTKSLSKKPQDYPDVKNQPHLQVALRMVAANMPVNVGDHIPYIICKAGGGTEDKSCAQRAHHPDEIFRSEGALLVDIEWYIEHQILPPIKRLCEPIDGTSGAQLAACLGLDTIKHSLRSDADAVLSDNWGFVARSRMDFIDRFRSCSRLISVCKDCMVEAHFPDPAPYLDGCDHSIKCNECGSAFFGHCDGERFRRCMVSRSLAVSGGFWAYRNLLILLFDTQLPPGFDFYSPSTQSNLVTALVRKALDSYYDSWLQCDDATCARRTVRQSVRGYVCTGNCHGKMLPVFDPSALYTQMKYFERIFAADEQKHHEVRSFIIHELKKLRRRVSGIVDDNAYAWVRPSLWTTVFENTSK